MALARTIGTAHGFALQDNWLMSRVLHQGARQLAVVLWLASCVAVRWPVGPWKKLDASRRLQFAVTAGACALAVSALKSLSPASCPWDMTEFGGVALHISHWAMRPDGGGGRCFPSGHASSGFVFLAGYFAFRDVNPRWARGWLWGACAAGLALGAVQQMRGAHFMSHTLWTGWLCWTIALTLDLCWPRRRAPAEGPTDQRDAAGAMRHGANRSSPPL
jgi:membrane-associated PAP2 superfamily phosphatase